MTGRERPTKPWSLPDELVKVVPAPPPLPPLLATVALARLGLREHGRITRRDGAAPCRLPVSIESFLDALEVLAEVEAEHRRTLDDPEVVGP